MEQALCQSHNKALDTTCKRCGDFHCLDCLKQSFFHCQNCVKYADRRSLSFGQALSGGLLSGLIWTFVGVIYNHPIQGMPFHVGSFIAWSQLFLLGPIVAIFRWWIYTSYREDDPIPASRGARLVQATGLVSCFSLIFFFKQAVLMIGIVPLLASFVIAEFFNTKRKRARSRSTILFLFYPFFAAVILLWFCSFLTILDLNGSQHNALGMMVALPLYALLYFNTLDLCIRSKESVAVLTDTAHIDPEKIEQPEPSGL